MRHLTIIAFSLIVFRCGIVYAQKNPAAKKVTSADIALGQNLLLKSDCSACHKVDAKLLGPSYIDIARKYPPTEANYQLLAQKIINGGSGVWGQIPMAPHPAIPAADIKKMLQYILSLKPIEKK